MGEKPVILPVEGQKNILITSALPYVVRLPSTGRRGPADGPSHAEQCPTLGKRRGIRPARRRLQPLLQAAEQTNPVHLRNGRM